MTYENAAAQEYDFDMFEPRTRASAGSAPSRARAGTAAAPRRKEAAPVCKPELRLVENKNKQPRQKDEKHTGLRSAVIVLVAVLVLGTLGLQIHAGARSYELSQQIEVMEKKISEAETENVRLANALNSVTTIDNIDNYARSVLGMSKCESYQIKCIDLSEGNQVLYSGSGIDLLGLFDKNN